MYNKLYFAKVLYGKTMSRPRGACYVERYIKKKKLLPGGGLQFPSHGYDTDINLYFRARFFYYYFLCNLYFIETQNIINVTF